MVIRVLILIVSVMKKWNHEMVNTILKNENYTGTLLQGKEKKIKL